ncbi:hypothetical protein R3P38DRAFT_3299364 [Favolaschia claudopus]|uniref:Protein kinase domain-containing protein n=1 Tax=Favolaschia claudopus TaxID=2862362 RepID=A0AAV9Z2P6_9AGAR
MFSCPLLLRCQGFLSENGVLLYYCDEFHNEPRPMMLPAADSFHPRDAEDFVHTVPGRCVRTPRDMWYPPRPAIELGLDRRTRQIIIKAVAPGAPSPPTCSKIPEAYRALLNDMGHPDPSVRPSARVALERLESLNGFQTAHQWCAS